MCIHVGTNSRFDDGAYIRGLSGIGVLLRLPRLMSEPRKLTDVQYLSHEIL
jgi:hypothetical protein